MTHKNLYTEPLNGTHQDDFPIVGIGASAGGLEALEQFFGNMPGNTGMAFVVIQHLDPTNPGIMPELMQRTTPMKVMQASDGLKVKPDCVYVIPPNKSLSLLNNTLMLFDPVESRGLRLPIDVFFRSMALDRKDKSIAIVLSGMGSDGSQGIKAIKEENGMVLVQDPGFAKFDSMPSSAISAVVADIIAPADELPSRLIELVRFIPEPALEEETDQEVKKNKLDKIIVLLRDHVGHDFSLYKKTTLIRRIERRKGIHKLEKTSDYVRFLQENPNEIEILFKELLIGVTNFFRDPDLWSKLKSTVLPGLLETLPDGHVIRIWVTACSTGEEAYSIAILLKELIEETQRKITLQVFASDLDADAIEKARKGYYNNNIMADVSPERLNRFFIMEGEGYRVNTSIRETIVFALQNVIKDPPFTKLDLLFCRNMLIYMETELQKKLMALFNFSLNSGGILVLGTAETIGGSKAGFKELDPKLKIYKHTNTVSVSETVFPGVFNRHKAKVNEPKAVLLNVDNIQSLTDNIILQRFAPPTVLVNDKGDIIYITGRTGKYLEPVAGKANWNIYAMAREGLRHELPGAFRKVMQNYEPVILHHVKIGTDGGTQPVDVILQRIESPEAIRGSILIVFKDLPMEAEVASGKTRKVRSSRQRDLENELQRSYEELQSTREEMQTSQEELRSINEELQSTNEELQSTNEELTTSREEMQSLNEELQTVNMELQSKVNDYVQSNNDMKNLLNSTEIATLFLDKELNIRRFTDSITHIFKLRTTDIGRPITDLVTNLQYPDIDKHARQVLKTLFTIETPVSTLNSKWYNTRIMPYRTSDDRIDGLVITFTDITKHKLLEIELNDLKKQDT